MPTFQNPRANFSPNQFLRGSFLSPGPPLGPTPLNCFKRPMFPAANNKPVPLNATPAYFENNIKASSDTNPNWRSSSLQGAPLHTPNNFFQLPSTFSNNDDEEVSFFGFFNNF